MSMPESDPSHQKRVRHFRQILLWPLQLMPIRGSQIQRHWELLEQGGADHPWHEVLDEFTGDPAQFQDRHYSEFVTFLPYVQRFLYGEGRTPRGRDGRDADPGASPMRVFRRDDIAAVRVVSPAQEATLTLSIAHVDLYFFFDIDIVLLNVEMYADDLTLHQAQDTLYRLGRAYPPAWDEHGQGLHCMKSVEWLSADGTVLAVSDAEQRESFLAFVGRNRAPRICSHWAFLLRPLVLDPSQEQGPIRYRQIEYYRMPVMAYLAIDDPGALSRNDFIRLGLVTAAGGGETLPYSDRHVSAFEERYCYDRFWGTGCDGPNTRYLCCGHALAVVGDARSPFFTDKESGVLAQFRHQHFLLFLIPHFQKAALLMFSDRLAQALKRLDIGDPGSVKRFKRVIRQNFEIFLRFTHRYWFHEVADQAQARALFRLCAGHLELDALYAEVKERIHDMNEYLDSDSLRRQANTVIRLTVVTTFGLIGTLTTGYFGMNILVADLLGAATSQLGYKLGFFAAILAAAIALLVFTVAKAKRLSDFLDALSDERLSAKVKLGAFFDIWKPRGPSR